MKFLYAFVLLVAACQLSDSFVIEDQAVDPVFFNDAIKWIKEKIINPINEKVVQPLKSVVQKIIDKLKGLKSISLSEIQKRIEKEFLGPFYDKVVAPLEEKFLKPLGVDLKQKIREWGVKNVEQLKVLLQERVITPLDEQITQEFSKHVDNIVESVFKFLSQEARDNSKVVIFQLFQTKIREPFLNKINDMVLKIQFEFFAEQVADAQVVFLNDALKFIKDKIINPIDEKIVQPFKNLVGKFVDKIKGLKNISFSDIFKRIETELLNPFYERIISPLEEQFLRPLERDLKQKVKEWGLTSLDQLKNFLKESVVDPLEDKVFNEFEKQVDTIIETFFKSSSQEQRDNYKATIIDMFDSKIRQPLMNRINKILGTVDFETYTQDAEIVFLSDALKFIKDKIISPIDEKLVQPFKNLVGNLIEKLKSIRNISISDTLKRIESEFLTPFYNRVIAPLEEKFLKPLERDLKQKIKEWGISGAEKLKDFLRESVVGPLEDKIFKEFEGQVETIVETLFKLSSQETRDHYKQTIIEMFDIKIRQPLMDKINKILMRVEE